MPFSTPPSLLSWRGRADQPRPWAVLALAVLLLVAQGLWSAHATHHVTDDHDIGCALCLIGGGAAAGLLAALPAVAPCGPAGATATSVLPPAAPCRAVFRPQSPRAPPLPASIRR
jgi:hypothetical protein